MTDAAAPILVSVIALAIHDLTRRTVAEQGQLRAQIEKLLQDALRTLPAAGRIVLDAPQGFVVAVLDGRHAALELAERVQTGGAELPLCIGINYGPVAILADDNRGHALVGDGITAAMTMTQAAAPGRMTASRPFHEALQAEAPDSAARLIAAGVHMPAVPAAATETPSTSGQTGAAIEAEPPQAPPCPCCGGRMVVIEVLPDPRWQKPRLDSS